ncbi:MAG: DUF2254 domain-containing protein [Clostridia bacterium]|nr:DUF2254 domain-containing protein [Clostridia bacterium]
MTRKSDFSNDFVCRNHTSFGADRGGGYVKKWIRKLKESLWLKPAIIGLFSLLLAVLVGLLDSGRYLLLENFLPPMLMTSVELSRTILGVIAGALITMTIFTFSTTMVVLTTILLSFRHEW